MRPQTRALLLASDSVGFDPAVDYDALRDELAALKPRLEAILGRQLSLLDNNEEANFLLEWVVFDPRHYDEETGCGRHIFLIAIGLSSFGRMACVYTNRFDGGDLSGYPAAELEAELEARGFRVMPYDELKEPYDGPNQLHYPHCSSWWDRYFGYCWECDCAIRERDGAR